MIILSVDYGDSRTGIAVCDKLQMLASPVEVIHEAYPPKIIKRICEIASELKAERIVVGLPRNMDSSVGERAQKCIQFANDIQAESGIETVTFDERLTTVQAHNYLNVTNVRGAKRKNVVDSVAAVIILQDYLSSLKL